MTPRRFRLLPLLGAAVLAAGPAMSPAMADIALPLRPAADPKVERTAGDAINCVAGVLTFRTAEARNYCGRVIAALPDEPLGYKYRGLAFLLEHEFEKAEEDFHAAVRLNPGDAENQAGYAQSLSGQGRFGEALAGFDEALRLQPKDIRYLSARCWARMGEGRNLDNALADCNAAVNLAPNYATARLDRGMVRLKQRNYRAALQDFTRALDLDADLPTALFGRGFAYLQLKDNDRAQADIRAARKGNATIDNVFIRTGILPASCRDASAPCPLPAELRNPPPAGLIGVSHQPSPDNRVGLDDIDDVLRAMALERLDGMLETVALRLDARPAMLAGPSLMDEDTQGAARHLQRIQAEYRRLQRLACGRAAAQGSACQAPAFHYSPAMQDDARALETEIDHTLGIVRVLWTGVCRQPGGKACRIE